MYVFYMRSPKIEIKKEGGKEGRKGGREEGKCIIISVRSHAVEST